MIRSFVHFDVQHNAETSTLCENKASEKLELRITHFLRVVWVVFASVIRTQLLCASWKCELGEHGIPAPPSQDLTGRGRNSMLTEFALSMVIQGLDFDGIIVCHQRGYRCNRAAIAALAALAALQRSPRQSSGK